MQTGCCLECKLLDIWKEGMDCIFGSKVLVGLNCPGGHGWELLLDNRFVMREL